MNKELVFLIDDEAHYLELYQETLKDSFDCLCFSNALDALEALKTKAPKTIVLDLNLPDLNGIEFCYEMSKQPDTNSDADVIFISGESDTRVKLKAFDAGASDFLVKPFELKELLFKVKHSV